MVGRDFGESVLRQPNPIDLHARAFVIDVIEMHDWEKPWVSAPAPQMLGQINAMQLFREHILRERPRPFVEVTEHDLGADDTAIVNAGGQLARLVAPLQQRRAQMDVVKVQDIVLRDLQVDTLRKTRLAGFPAQVVLLMMLDREVREHDIAKERIAQMPRRRHHPPEAERRADFGRVARLQRACANHFLQRDDVGVDRGEHRSNPLWPGAAIKTTAAVDVIGDNPEGNLVWHRLAGVLAVAQRQIFSPGIRQCTLGAWPG